MLLAKFARQQNGFDGDRHRQKSVPLRLLEHSARLQTDLAFAPLEAKLPDRRFRKPDTLCVRDYPASLGIELGRIRERPDQAVGIEQ